MTVGASGTALVATTSIAVSSGTLPTCTGMTWNGVAMQPLGNLTDGGGLFGIWVFGLASPATGNKSLVASYSGTFTSVNGTYLDAASFKGTQLTTAACFPSGDVITLNQTTTGAVFPNSAWSVNTAAGDMALASLNALGSQYAGMSTGTLLRTDAANNGQTCWGYNAAAGSTTSLQFNGGGAQAVVAVGIHIAALGATLVAGTAGMPKMPSAFAVPMGPFDLLFSPVPAQLPLPPVALTAAAVATMFGAAGRTATANVSATGLSMLKAPAVSLNKTGLAATARANLTGSATAPPLIALLASRTIAALRSAAGPIVTKTSLAARAISTFVAKGSFFVPMALTGTGASKLRAAAGVVIGIPLFGATAGNLRASAGSASRAALAATGRAEAFAKAATAYTVRFSATGLAVLRGAFGPPAGKVALAGQTIAAMFGKMIKPGAIAIFGTIAVKMMGRFGPATGTVPLSGTLKLTSQSRSGLAFIQLLKGSSAIALKATAGYIPIIALRATAAISTFGKAATAGAVRLTAAGAVKTFARSTASGITALRGQTAGMLQGAAGYVARANMSAIGSARSFGRAIFAKMAVLSGIGTSTLRARALITSGGINLFGRSSIALRATAGLTALIPQVGRFGRFILGMAMQANITGMAESLSEASVESAATIIGTTMMTTHDPLDFVCGDNWVLTGPLQDANGNALNLSSATITWKLDKTNPTTGAVTNQLTLALSSGITISNMTTATIFVEATAAQTAVIPPGQYTDWLRVTLATGEVFTEWTGVIRAAPNPT